MKVGIVGHGTVGSGVSHILNDLYPQIEIKVADINFKTEDLKFFETNNIFHTDNWKDLLDADVIVETVGGKGLAFEIWESALKNGKKLVTANKSLLATQKGSEFWLSNFDKIGIEASVGGTVPIITTLENYFKGDLIETIEGILNGTTNFILDKMTNESLEYENALKGAQDLGFAEADPTDDVEGIDTANKIAILSTLAFGKANPRGNDKIYTIEDVNVEGITKITLDQIHEPKTAGFFFKLIAFSDGKNLTVAPKVIHKDNYFAQIKEGYNLIEINSKYGKKYQLFGLGAGSYPTAAAIVNDVIRLG